jgi:hypothetical protein
MNNVSLRSPFKQPVVWSVPGKPVEVVVSRSALGQLATKAAARNASSDVREFGGVLLGRIEQTGDIYRTYVEALEPLRIEYRFGNTFVLSSKDRGRLHRLLRKTGNAELTPVGWYRSHERRGLYLGARDLDLFQAEFPHPGAVVLLVRQEGDGRVVGGFFIREDTELQQHDTYLKFPISEPPAQTDEVPDEPLDDGQLSHRYPTWVLPVLSALAGFVLMISSYYAGREIAAYRYRQSHSRQVAPVTEQQRGALGRSLQAGAPQLEGK